MPLISIIVPVYNVEKFIADCLKSIQTQTLADFEVICVDDGSPDNSADIIRSFMEADDRIRLIRRENGGLSAARNTGMKEATGTYIYFLDSDDYIHPQALEILYTAVLKTNALVAAAAFKETTQRYDSNMPTFDVKTLPYQVIEDPLLTDKIIPISAWSKLYHRQALNGFSFIEGIYFEDVPFTLSLLGTLDKIAYVPAPIYYYYQSPVSIMRSGFTVKKILSYVTGIQYLYAFYQTNYPDLVRSLQVRKFSQIIKQMTNAIIRTRAKDPQIYAELKETLRRELKPLMEAHVIDYSGLTIRQKMRLFRLMYF